MIALLNLVGWGLLTIVGFPSLILCAELAAGLFKARRLSPYAGELTIAVLMPAHNECVIIAKTVLTTISAMRSSDRLLVVADNSSDDTAALARAAGASVIERNDPDRRGKGFALACGMSELESSAPDAVVILDADCEPTPGAIERIARLAIAHGRPIQASYVFRPTPQAGPVTRISNFAFMLKNRIRQRGMMRLGGTCVLTGSGMAFPWQRIVSADLANGEIVEDLVMGLRMTQFGFAPLYDDWSEVFSEGAPNDAETVRQRRRWEHGFVSTALSFAPRLLRLPPFRGARARVWTVLHLMVPPLMLLLAALAALVFVFAAAAFAGTINPALVLLAGAISAVLVTFLGLSWLLEGREYLAVKDLLNLPAYLGSKLGIWSSFVKGREKIWTKTGR